MVQTDALAELKDSVHPIFLDVADADRKPAEGSDDAASIPTHLSIRGAVWLPGAGSGTGDPVFERAFKARISALTAFNLDRPIVVFCHPRCWAGWNAAKRLVGLSYHHVFWYPQGIEAWQTMYATEIVKGDADWISSIRSGGS